MSPNVGNFVHDLVEMAKATETLPIVERNLEIAKQDNEILGQRVQALELRALERKAEIDELHTKLNAAEVARDDAEYRFLELDDKTGVTVNMLRALQASLGIAVEALDPPKPESVKEPEASPTEHSSTESGDGSTLGVNGAEETPLGQSEGRPTASTEEQSPNVTSAPTENASQSSSASVDPGPALGPYSGKRYADHPGYVSRSDWLDGGGTNEDYDYHLSHQGF